MRRVDGGQLTQLFYGNQAAWLGRESRRVDGCRNCFAAGRGAEVKDSMAEILVVDRERPQPERIARAAQLIRAGELVGIPTDTVYGVACDAWNAAAAEKVFAVKQRAATAPLLILVNSLEMAHACMGAPSTMFDTLARRFWPGPLTIVVEAASRIPPQVTAGTSTVGIRYPDSPIVLALIAALGGPITATSANLSGHPECRSAAAVNDSLGAGLALVLDGGPSGEAEPSTLVSVVDGVVKLLRQGAVSRKAISDFLTF